MLSDRDSIAYTFIQSDAHQTIISSAMDCIYNLKLHN